MINVKEQFLAFQEIEHILDLGVKILNTFEIDKKTRLD